MLEVPICAQHDKLIPQAKLRKQRIDRPDLQTSAPAIVAKFCSDDVIFALWNDQRQGNESIEDLLSGFGSVEALQNLLQDQTRGEDRSLALQGFCQELDAGMTLGPIAA